MRRCLDARLLILGTLLCGSCLQGEGETSWTLFPSYRLPHEAAGLHAVPVPLPEGLWERSFGLAPETYQGGLPTHRWLPETPFRSVPPFTIELLTVDHSHYPTGVLLMGREASGAKAFHIGYFANATDVTNGVERVFHPSQWRSAYNRYWRHIVLSVDANGNGTVYTNGVLNGTLNWTQVPACETWEVAAYNQADPLMRIENILHRMRFHSMAMSAGLVAEAFQEMATAVYNGWRFPGHFHFIAGPSLSYVTTDEAYLTVEADRSTRARVQWGYAENAMTNEAASPTLKGIHTLPLRGLQAGSQVHYRVTVEDAEGTLLSSERLTFKTAAAEPEAVRFAVIGDTESRPWIGDCIAKNIWAERPDFVVHLGDITDNGEKGRKPQWTHEYFSGLEQLQSRVPVFAVPGNGEDDNLYWYQRYFPAPRNQGNASGYFTFSWGMVDFFMLDSNERSSQFQPGGRQYAWLEQQLAAATGRWKVVCFHHPGPPGTYGDEPSVRALEPLYEKYGVNLVLNGHKHTYERSKPRRGDELSPEGVTYIISGGAGGNLKDEAGEFPVSSYTEKVYRNYHHMVFEATTTALVGRALDLEGREIDRFAIGDGTIPWASAFPNGVGPFDGWIYSPQAGWVYVGAWPWCYWPKPQIPFNS